MRVMVEAGGWQSGGERGEGGEGEGDERRQTGRNGREVTEAKQAQQGINEELRERGGGSIKPLHPVRRRYSSQTNRRPHRDTQKHI